MAIGTENLIHVVAVGVGFVRVAGNARPGASRCDDVVFAADEDIDAVAVVGHEVALEVVVDFDAVVRNVAVGPHVDEVDIQSLGCLPLRELLEDRAPVARAHD